MQPRLSTAERSGIVVYRLHAAALRIPVHELPNSLRRDFSASGEGKNYTVLPLCAENQIKPHALRERSLRQALVVRTRVIPAIVPIDVEIGEAALLALSR
jgi:hypothetical protein